jgi:arabinofuranan 3-O-arabinosyltransferase
VAAKADLRPAVRLNWLGQRTVRGLRLSAPLDTAARLPERVTVIWPGGRVSADVIEGRVRFPPVVTDQLTIRVDEAESAVSLDFAAVPSAVPVGIGELRVYGVPYLPVRLSDQERELGCGTGPDYVLDNARWRTSLRASPAQLYSGDELDVEPCSLAGEPSTSVTLSAGPHEVAAEASAAFAPVSVVLGGSPFGEAIHPVEVTRTSAVRRTVEPSAGDRVVAVRENTNPGWRASQGGSPVEPVVLDGWQQGWRVTGADPVNIDFAPDQRYQRALGAGLVGLAL